MLTLLLLVPFSLCCQVNSWRVHRVPRPLHTLLRRQCEWDEEDQDFTDCDFNLPTIEQLVARIHNIDDNGLGDAEHHALFYSNLADEGMEAATWEVWPHGWMKTRISKYLAQDEWVEDHRDKFPKYDGKPDEILAECYYQALAEAAINPDVYFFTKKNEEWSPDSIWQKIEYPYLTRNSKVQRIYRVDTRPPEIKKIKPEEVCKHDRPELLWKRGRDAEVPIIWSCPVQPAAASSSSSSSSSTTTSSEAAATMS